MIIEEWIESHPKGFWSGTNTKVEDIKNEGWYRIEYMKDAYYYTRGNEYKSFLKVAEYMQELEYKLIFGIKDEQHDK